MFNVGEKYSRTKDIHDIYGGGRQGGISPSASYPYIFLFTGDSGKAYGYEDGWQNNDGVFLYTGEGQIGDMEFSRGNKAVRDHVENGKRLFLFKNLGKGKPVEYLGEYECASIGFGKGLDRNENTRKTIRFDLVPLDQQVVSEKVNVELSKLSLKELRDIALQSVSPPETSKWKNSKQIKRKRSETSSDHSTQSHI
mgnify:FL=1